MFEATFDIHQRTPIEIEFETSPRNPIEVIFNNYTRISKHNQLLERDADDCHPIKAITGLEDNLNTLSRDITAEQTTRENEDIILQNQINAVSILANGYIHEQGIASSEWIVNHNLNKYPSVSVVDSAENEILAEVEYLSKNSVKITMKGASKGRAYLN